MYCVLLLYFITDFSQESAGADNLGSFSVLYH